MSKESTAWDKLTAISSLVLANTGVVALLIAWHQIQEAREEARIQHLIEFVQRFDGADFIKIRKSLAHQRIDKISETLLPLSSSDPPTEIYDELNLCDSIGHLVARGYLDRHDVWSELSYWLFPLYADARPVIEAEQKTNPASFVECQKLVESMRPIEDKEDKGTDNHLDNDDIYSFYAGDDEASPAELQIHGRRHPKQ